MTDAQATAEAGDRRLSEALRGRAGLVAVMGGVLTLLVWIGWLFIAFTRSADGGTLEAAVDFHTFWAAARLALAGEPLAAFDIARLAEAHGVSVDGWLPWSYPPGFLALLMPFGALPFAAGYAAFGAVSLLAAILAFWRFAGGSGTAVLATAAAPTVLPALLMGQTSLLWAAGLVAALAALRAERPVLAGVLIGCLTLKPQLGLLIPLALIAAGKWRTFAAATATTLVLLILPTLVFGIAYWEALGAMMAEHGARVRAAIAETALMISPYAGLAGLGLAEPLALGLHWALAAGAALAVVWAWRAPLGFDAKAAVLVSAVLLTSPYLWYYETALLAAALLFAVRAGLWAHPAGRLVALAMWLGAGPAMFQHILTQDEVSYRALAAPILPIAFLACILLAFRTRFGVSGARDAAH